MKSVYMRKPVAIDFVERMKAFPQYIPGNKTSMQTITLPGGSLNTFCMGPTINGNEVPKHPQSFFMLGVYDKLEHFHLSPDRSYPPLGNLADPILSQKFAEKLTTQDMVVFLDFCYANLKRRTSYFHFRLSGVVSSKNERMCFDHMDEICKDPKIQFPRIYLQISETIESQISALFKQLQKDEYLAAR